MTRRRSRGFTLLEVMVAFVILAVALGLLLGMLSRGLKQVTQAGNETEAALYAQSLLDAVGTLEAIEPGARAGEFDGGRYRWRLQVEEAPDPAPPPPPPEGEPQPNPGLGAPVLYRVVLEVEWGARTPQQRLRYSTLRLRAPANPGAGAGVGAVASGAAP
jgi:general secretion pathway protein I